MSSRLPMTIIKAHENWRISCVNLIPSENIMSPAARGLLSCDMGHRYTLPGIREMDGRLVENAYRGTRFMDEVEELARELANRVFGSRYSCVRPISGHISCMIALAALCESGDSIMSVEFSGGGYPGYAEEEMAGLLGLRSFALPFDHLQGDLAYPDVVEEIGKREPDVVIMGASKMLFPPRIEKVKEVCESVDARIMYDGSHVLGLLAGGVFGEPLDEGADLIAGSTHKTLFGPQGGIILTEDREVFDRVESSLHWKTIDNAHWNRIASLAQALLEIKKFGKDYAGQLVLNAKHLARTLDSQGFPVQYAHRDYTESHQVGLDGGKIADKFGYGSFEEVARKLEKADIIIDCVGRLGTSECTRLGMKEREMEVIAELISRVIVDGEDTEKVAEDVHRLRADFQFPAFCEL